MNEGHSAFLVTELMKKKSLDNIIDSCVFTTHTPVEAGLEKFDYWKYLFHQGIPLGWKTTHHNQLQHLCEHAKQPTCQRRL